MDSRHEQSTRRSAQPGTDARAVSDGVGEVYLDYNASSPLDPRVAEAMMPMLTDAEGNASSLDNRRSRRARSCHERVTRALFPLR